MSTRDDLGIIWPGVTWTGTFTWTDDAGDEQNLTGYTATMRVGLPRGEALFTLTHSSGLTLGGVAGTIVVVISAAQSALLKGYGVVSVDLDVANGGVVTPIVRGELTIGAGVEPAA